MLLKKKQRNISKISNGNDLFNKLQGAKNSGEILTVHRYGSSSIRGDHNLVFAIQESIEKAFKDKGIENKGNSALKGAIIKWLEDSANKNYFNSLGNWRIFKPIRWR